MHAFQGLLVADELYDVDWYKLDLEVQKRIPILIAINRQPRYFTGYGVVTASRDAFKEVIR